MCSVNERIEKLKRETKDLRKEVKDLKVAILQQNELIISLLLKQTAILDESIEAEQTLPNGLCSKKISEFSRRFPLKNVKDLEKFESEINEDNESHIINIVQTLLATKGLSKSISNVLCENVIMDINVDGCHNKKRLLNYPKTIDIIFQASRKENDDYNSEAFLNDLRRALRRVKNRIHKNNCQARQKLREQEHKQLVPTVEQHFIKTEEVDFD